MAGEQSSIVFVVALLAAFDLTKYTATELFEAIELYISPYILHLYLVQKSCASVVLIAMKAYLAALLTVSLLATTVHLQPTPLEGDGATVVATPVAA